MKIGQIIFFSYSVFLSSFITVGALTSVLRRDNPLFFIAFFPVSLYFGTTLIRKLKNPSLELISPARIKILIYYNFVLVTIMTLMGFVEASSVPQLISAILFFPLASYFWLLTFPKRSRKVIIPKGIKIVKLKKLTESGTHLKKGFDPDRRMFVKLIGSTGLSLFFFSLFTKKAQAAFFGSVPGPGTVSLKDTDGAQIDPAIKQPTDGYKISEVDDSSLPAYYGFVDKTGKWFIMREEDTGAYRYTKGDSSFSANWALKGNLSYGYFDAVF